MSDGNSRTSVILCCPLGFTWTRRVRHGYWSQVFWYGQGHLTTGPSTCPGFVSLRKKLYSEFRFCLMLLLDIYSFEMQSTQKEGETERWALPSHGSLPNQRLQRTRLAKLKPKNQECLQDLLHGYRAQEHGPSSVAFPGTFARSWIQSGAAWSLNHIHVEC